MQYDAKTPKEYLSLLEDDWRKEKLLAIRDLIFKSYSFEEGIQYKMLSYGKDDRLLFHLNAQANYVSLYVGNIDKVNGARNLLKGLDLGKGCIRVKKPIDVNNTKLAQFISDAVKLWVDGGDLEC